tara:strand:- start:167 stop:1084 length:918 start_codon:yes stop_codon:yes gene_type:complete
MAVTNALTYAQAETNGAAVAEILANEITQALYDPTDLRSVCTRISYNAAGSDTMNVIQDIAPAAFAASGENTTLASVAYTTTSFDLALVQYRRAYAAADLLPVSGSPVNIDRMVANLMQGVAMTFTSIICDALPTLTAQVGTSGVALQVDDIYDGIFTLNSALNSGPYTCVLSPVQWNHFQSSLRSEVGSAQFLPATNDTLASHGPGFRGSWMGVDFYVADAVDTSGGNDQGGIFTSGCLAYGMGSVSAMASQIPAANLIVDAGELVVELDRTAADGVSAAYATMIMGVAVADQSRGCEILSSAT